MSLVGEHCALQSEVFMWEELGRAFCLMLVLEGIIPFLYPARWRRLVASLAEVTDKQLRSMGLVSMAIGVGLLYLIN
ncbi:DUF2065 domain-containing protein [Cellvibrio japonicus]|nr:DUF2065 domain-containing protein [Cellvibrio japonicus]